MLDKRLILKIFEAFSIERWNDLVRPFQIIEMDKAAEKMVLAYVFGKFEENKGTEIDWEWMIYASVFDLLRKIALCDIKAPVQHLMKKEYPSEYMRLNEWVLSQYRSLIHDDELFSRFTLYVGQSSGLIPLTDTENTTYRIFRAAHKYSTLRELDMISMVNEPRRLDAIRRELEDVMQGYLDLRALQLLLTRQRPFDFLMIIEQLRFQRRWNQTPRVPATSVLGHCFFVALLTVLLARETSVNFSPVRLYDDFFSALFHDLPESVTRDIISPVKQATDELPHIVKEIEEMFVRKELLPYMEDFYSGELLYFTSDEFCNRVMIDGKTKIVSWEELNSVYTDKDKPVDGKLVRLADHLSALLEADSSIRHGITSTHLENGRKNMLKLYADGELINGIDAASLFRSIISR
ncbi:HD domain-containing protein [Treponema parvum]|uniref:HD domain-containing protein n=1 Tax=Treponema parvum TaxID=138851 RepID=UPI001AEBBD1A|nr:HD domain-containing protein [Treponema parvum]QTQ15941.1 HD domain-containing protein [Treponema parvum]